MWLFLLATVFFRVNAFATPCAGLSSISGRDTVCAGGFMTLTDSTTGGVWSSGDTTKAIINASTGSVTGILGGTATITYTLSPGCFVTRVIVINALLPIIGDTAVCAGSSVVFSDLTPGGTWTSNNTSVATITPGTGVGYGVASGITVITYTLPNGCNRKQVLQVNPLPLNYYVFGGGIYCAGTGGVTIGLNGSDTGINYKLYRDDTVFVDSLDGTGSAIFFGPIAPEGVYSIIGVNIHTGCSKRMSDIATVGTTPLNIPSVSIASSTGNDTVCILAAATFSAIPTNGGGSPSYHWYVNGASVGSGDTYSYIPDNGDVVEVVLYSTAVCAIPGTADTSMIVATIPRVSPSVSISVSPSDTVCLLTPVSLVASAVYGGPSPTYRWIKNGYTATIAPTYSYMPSTGDNVLAVIYSDYQCLLTDSAYSNNVNITVQPLLIPTVSATAYPGTTIGVGQTDTIVAIVINGGTALHYQWQINGIDIPGAIDDTLISNFSAGLDTVNCVVTSADFCGGIPYTASLVITDTLMPTLGVGAAGRGASNIQLLPNPNNGTFMVQGTFPGGRDEAVIEITDVMGQIVYSDHTPAQKGVFKTSVQLRSELANGVYLIRISAGGTAVVRRFTLSR